MERRFTTSGLMMALVAGLCAACGHAALAQGQPVPPPRMAGPGGPEGGPPLDARADAISDKELAERLRTRANEVEHLAQTLREAAAKVDQGEGRLEALRMIEVAHRPLRGDWLERLSGRRMGDRARDGRDDRMVEGSEFRGPESRGPEGRGPDGRDGRGPDSDRTLTDAERDSMMTFAREKLPRMAHRIDQLRQTDPEMADRIMLRLAPRVREVLATRDADLAALRLEELQTGAVVLDQVRVLREAMKAQDPAATESAKAELRTALVAQFDAKVNLQQHEVTMLNKRIESLRADIQKRQAAKDDFINKLLDRMSGDEVAPGEGPEGMMGGTGRGPDGRGPEGRRGGQRGDGPRGDGQGPREGRPPNP